MQRRIFDRHRDTRRQVGKVDALGIAERVTYFLCRLVFAALDVQVGRVFYAELLAAPLVDLALKAAVAQLAGHLLEEYLTASVRFNV